jgi:hypothetical protein
VLSLFNDFRASEFNYYSLERLCAVFLANSGPQPLELAPKSGLRAIYTCLDACAPAMDESF